MQYHVEVTYDSRTIIKGARAYWKRKYRQDIVLSPLVLLAVVFGGISSEQSGFLYGVVLTVSVVYFIVVYYLGLILPYRSVAYWKKSGLRKANIVFSDEGILAETEMGVSRFEWSKVRSVWELNGI